MSPRLGAGKDDSEEKHVLSTDLLVLVNRQQRIAIGHQELSVACVRAAWSIFAPRGASSCGERGAAHAALAHAAAGRRPPPTHTHTHLGVADDIDLLWLDACSAERLLHQVEDVSLRGQWGRG